MNVTDQFHIGNLSHFFYDNGNERIVCSTCGAVEDNKHGDLTPSRFVFLLSVFVDNHNRCKLNKSIRCGDAVTDLAGSYLGKIKSISHKDKVAFVKDSFRYKKTHKLSELLISK